MSFGLEQECGILMLGGGGGGAQTNDDPARKDTNVLNQGQCDKTNCIISI